MINIYFWIAQFLRPIKKKKKYKLKKNVKTKEIIKKESKNEHQHINEFKDCYYDFFCARIKYSLSVIQMKTMN